MALVAPCLAVGLVAGLPATAGVSDPKAGRYVGIGEEGFRIGLDVNGAEVEEPVYAITYDDCSTATNHPEASDEVDAKGRYRMDIDDGTAQTTLKGRFRTERTTRGEITWEQTNPALCPGTYQQDYVAGRIASIPSAGPGSGNPRNGIYAGGSGDLSVWLEVRQGVVSDVVLHGKFPSCAQWNEIQDDDAPPDSGGRFSFLRVDGMGGSTFFRGRFKTRTTLIGKVVWVTTSSCPAGSYDFKYRAKRFEVPD